MKIPGKISIANIPTPLHKISFKGSKFYMKRDDMTGVELSGNKVRKLEYLLFEAKRQKVDYVFTCGGEQSNHARATAIAAASCGINSRLFLWGSKKKIVEGNLFLSAMVDPELTFLSKKNYFNVHKIMQDEKEKIIGRNKKVFVIPEGGSSSLGIWGYVNFIDELKQQIDLNKIKGLVVAAGSGGTAAGLLIGAALNGLKLKVFAVNVLFDEIVIKEKILKYIRDWKKEFNYESEIITDNLEILSGYSTEGYKNISTEKVTVIKDFARSTGIILDPAYTGKAFFAYNENFLRSNKLSNVMFIHTGGLFGAFSKRKIYLET